MDDDTDIINTGGEAPAQETGPLEAAPKPKRRRKPVAPKPPPKPAIFTARDELVAARRRARATQRVGWESLRDDVRRGRLLSLGGLAVILAVGISLATSQDYTVQQVTVLDSKALSVEQATRMSGVLGTNIFLVNPERVEAQIMKASFVKSVQVSTELPNRVTIRIEERKPSVVWVLTDGTPYSISDDGVVIGTAPTLDGYVVIYDLDMAPDALKPGDPLERRDVVETAQQLYIRLKRVTGLNISQMEYRIAGGLTVVTDNGHRVMFGDATGLEDKMRICASLVKDLTDRGQQWSLIDLRSPERAAVRG